MFMFIIIQHSNLLQQIKNYFTLSYYFYGLSVSNTLPYFVQDLQSIQMVGCYVYQSPTLQLTASNSKLRYLGLILFWFISAQHSSLFCPRFTEHPVCRMLCLLVSNPPVYYRTSLQLTLSKIYRAPRRQNVCDYKCQIF